jgi:hypothetical protein
MTLFVHKLVDAIDRGELVTQPGTRQQEVALLRRASLAAEKFDFGLLPLEPFSEPTNPFLFQFKLPQLTEDERMFWREGLVPLPAAVCWFEFKLQEPGERSALLVTDDGKSWTVERIDVVEDRITYDGVISVTDRGNDEGAHQTLYFRGNRTIIDKVVKSESLCSRLYGSAFLLSVYLCLMLNSRTTESAVEVPPERLNHARVKRGCAPLAQHRVVTIAPARYYDHGDGPSDRRPPRLHWRRSHLRHLKSGKRIVIPRFLVGRADLGEVTHEYRVKP